MKSTCTFIHSFIYSCIYLLVHSFIHSFTFPFYLKGEARHKQIQNVCRITQVQHCDTQMQLQAFHFICTSSVRAYICLWVSFDIVATTITIILSHYKQCDNIYLLENPYPSHFMCKTQPSFNLTCNTKPFHFPKSEREKESECKP